AAWSRATTRWKSSRVRSRSGASSPCSAVTGGSSEPSASDGRACSCGCSSSSRRARRSTKPSRGRVPTPDPHIGGSLLVPNAFPPKIGGIQSYLHELWRRLPAHATTVFTTRYAGDTAFDAAQPFRILRGERLFLPTSSLARRVRALAREVEADVVFL